MLSLCLALAIKVNNIFEDRLGEEIVLRTTEQAVAGSNASSTARGEHLCNEARRSLKLTEELNAESKKCALPYDCQTLDVS